MAPSAARSSGSASSGSAAGRHDGPLDLLSKSRHRLCRVPLGSSNRKAVVARASGQFALIAANSASSVAVRSISSAISAMRCSTIAGSATAGRSLIRATDPRSPWATSHPDSSSRCCDGASPACDQRVDPVNGVEELGHGRIRRAHPIRRVGKPSQFHHFAGVADHPLRQRNPLTCHLEGTLAQQSRRLGAVSVVGLDRRARTACADSRTSARPRSSQSCASDSWTAAHSRAVGRSADSDARGPGRDGCPARSASSTSPRLLLRAEASSRSMLVSVQNGHGPSSYRAVGGPGDGPRRCRRLAYRRSHVPSSRIRSRTPLTNRTSLRSPS